MMLKYCKNGVIWYMIYFNGLLVICWDVYDVVGFLLVIQYFDWMNNL